MDLLGPALVCVAMSAAPPVGVPAHGKASDLMVALHRFAGVFDSDVPEKVTRITVFRFELSDAQLGLLRRLPRLKSVTFMREKGSRESPELSDSVLGSVLANKRVVEIGLGAELTDDGFALLGQSAHIQKLWTTQKIGSAQLLNLASMRGLRDLSCHVTGAEDSVIESISRLLHLHTLSLADGGIVPPHRLAPLRLARSLRRLDLSRCARLSDGILSTLGRIKSLENLDLSFTEITGAGFSELARLKSLQTLSLRGCPIVGSNLSRLAVAPDLRSLSLALTPVRDDDIATIAQLAKLRHLWVEKTKMTPAGRRTLQKLLPHTTIYE